MATIVHTDELLRTIAASVVAGVGITVIFSIAIWGAARFVELSGSERRVAAAGAGAIGLLAFALTLASVAVGLLVMLGD
jgi:threonine dehydrogenase-like Zn-dependent dehydrogenase